MVKYCRECKENVARYGLNNVMTHCKQCKKDGMRTYMCFCIVCLKKEPRYGPVDGKATHCVDCKLLGMQNKRTILCANCKQTTACYGLEAKHPTHCLKCKSPEMYDVIHKMCVKCSCKRPTFGIINGKATHCIDCMEPSMTDVMNDMCVVCKEKQPSFGIGIKATHCASCKLETMKDVVNKKCINCNNYAPSFGFTEVTHCGSCKINGMTDLKHKMCAVCGVIQACYGLVFGERTHCASCKTDEMFDVINHKCVKCQNTLPIFGTILGQSTHCMSCKEEHMYDVKNKMCEGCLTKRPFYGYEKKKPTHCSLCRKDNMENVVFNHVKCFNITCESRASNHIYQGYCFRCFIDKFPEIPIAKNYRIKEMTVVKSLTDKIDSLILNKKVTPTCSYRPDILKRMSHCNLIIEIDENQHKNYDPDDDTIRTSTIQQALSSPVVYLRFNPDTYCTKGKTIPSPWVNTSTGLSIAELSHQEWESRLAALYARIMHWTNSANVPMNDIIIEKLFYDD